MPKQIITNNKTSLGTPLTEDPMQQFWVTHLASMRESLHFYARVQEGLLMALEDPKLDTYDPQGKRTRTFIAKLLKIQTSINRRIGINERFLAKMRNEPKISAPSAKKQTLLQKKNEPKL